MNWIKSNKILSIGIFATLICLSVIGYVFFDMISGKPEPVNASQKASSKQSVEQVSVPQADGNAGTNAFGETKNKVSEQDVMDYIHAMSHQKVEAEQKWDHYYITEDRIQFLIAEVESGNFENEDLYLDILTRWSEGDFSKADNDHNAVWKLLGGTVGKATGIMSEEEEKQYLEDYEHKFK
ncbi:DUF6241 domain-containing protein [Metabacillus arenae]|uniref:Uncharacterized protein n=1 Tax=Metabacillus arenae TaxID=2771434 RepID=A0A926NHF5_9BACI|nr:DUF6241 domain-containing protein [Metabacillus arenae]MBD1380850.1 hypothetical protein [Metabacillus arenae]